MTTSVPKCKSVIVTGAATGIGAEVAKRMAADGRQVVVNYRNSGVAAEELCRNIRAGGGIATPIQADVTNPDDCERLVSEAVRLMGGLDGVIHNVGEFCWRPLTLMSVSEWDFVLKSNLSSVFYIFRAAQSWLLKSTAPNFVTIGLSPADGVRASTNVSAYSIAKLGVQMFTRSLASEVAKFGIRVNCVAPGLIDNGHLPPAQRDWMAKRVPTGRLGRADEIAAAISFLISEQAAYVNGATLAVSGGWDWLDRDATHDELVHSTFSDEIKP